MRSLAERGILAYMSTRCQVSSQHKLPTKEELHNVVTLSFFHDKEVIDNAIFRLVSEKKLIDYDGYLSDHAIDVL